MGELKQKAWRSDAVAKATGRARYADDLKFPNMLHAAPVYTSHVHARIVGIDATRAERISGVVRVITAEDAPGPCRFGQIMKDYRILADDKIRYNGDVVAVVVAEKIREGVARHAFADTDGERRVRVTVSVGVATFPVHALDREALLRQADDALYQAKHFGRDRVRAPRISSEATGS